MEGAGKRGGLVTARPLPNAARQKNQGGCSGEGLEYERGEVAKCDLP